MPFGAATVDVCDPAFFLASIVIPIGSSFLYISSNSSVSADFIIGPALLLLNDVGGALLRGVEAAELVPFLASSAFYLIVDGVLIPPAPVSILLPTFAVAGRLTIPIEV